MQQPLLQMTDVHKSYGQVKVTDAIDLTLQPGEALGIIGPNGAGKSTLFNLIAGGVAADKGTIHFEGLSLIHI